MLRFQNTVRCKHCKGMASLKDMVKFSIFDFSRAYNSERRTYINFENCKQTSVKLK